MPVSPLERYRRELAAGRLVPDAAQRRAVEAMQRLHEALRMPVARRRLFRGAASPTPTPGLYLHGPVGRGKTRLMDLFCACLSRTEVRRMHFHAFMQQVHAELRALEGASDPLRLVAARLRKRARVLCLDEFEVNDIVDAMLLGRLLDALFHRGLVLVTTSNSAPEDLYPDGLQRALFLPAIATLRASLEVVAVDGGQDYRMGGEADAAAYFWPLDLRAARAMEASFARFAPGPDGVERGALWVNERPIPVRGRSGDVVWFDFDDLCLTARSTEDFAAIARCFPTVLVSDVAALHVAGEDACARFIALVDQFYEHRTRLIVSAAAPPAGLYARGPLARRFRRAASRLVEMQSAEYLGAPGAALDLERAMR